MTAICRIRFFAGNISTSCNRRKNQNQICERLDRFLGNESFCRLLKGLHVVRKDSYKSDHRPIQPYLDEDCIRKPKHQRAFKFQECWVNRVECEKIIEGSCD